MIELSYSPPPSTGTLADVVPPYFLDDGDECMDFKTAQGAFDYIEKALPGVEIQVNINPHLAI